MTMTDLLLRAGMALVALAATVYHHAGFVITQDGQRLMPAEPFRRGIMPAQESKGPESPFHIRWLLPFLLRRRIWAWCVVSWACLVASTLLFPGDLWSAALWCSMPWFRCMAAAPVLVDAPSLAGALAARRWPSWWWGFLAPISERAPIWASLFSWSVGPAGCAIPLVWAVAYRAHTKRKLPGWRVGVLRGERWTDGFALLLCWGAGMAALLVTDWTLQELVIIAVAYGQMLVAHDTVRMAQWAAPVVLPRAVAVIPGPWRLAAVVVTWFNPWARAPRGQVLC